ncbi:MAG: peptidylprolyl isomerase [Gammaproteobacteria bacterium]
MNIRVNEKEITEQAINIESAYHQEPGADPRYAQNQAAVTLTIRELLLQRARQLGMMIPDNEKKIDPVIDELLERELDTPEADITACRHWYDKNPDQFRTPDLAEVRHILIAAPPELLEERESARVLAEKLIRQLQADPAKFKRLARQHSRCPSSKDGGLLGQISRGQTVPEFEDAIMRLDIGLAPTPVKTRYGFHVVEILQYIHGEVMSFESVQNKIASYLEETTWRRAVSQYIRLLAAEADIEGIDLDAAQSALVQ